MTTAPTTTETRVISGLAGPVDQRAAAQADLKLDAKTYARSLDCVHCGLCLPACPTYTQNGLEADSPRGRIYLMKGLSEGRIKATDQVVSHLDLCLDCRACETACPSGVVYHELIEATRAAMAPQRRRGPITLFTDFIFYRVFPYPPRLKLAVLPARLLQRFGLWKLLTRGLVAKLLPASIGKMQQMLPPHGSMWEKPLATRYPAAAPDGQRRATVGVLAGCVGSVMFQHVNRQMIHLLQHAGCDVIVPSDQACCGAILHHGGRVDEASFFARLNIEAFERTETQGIGPVDFIVTNIAGCGAMLREYGHLLRDDPHYAERAEHFENRVRDISEVLVDLLPGPAPHAVDQMVTYHDACHLAHAQKVTDPPRRLLATIPGLRVVPLPESDMCCGAAGTYNLAQPDMARDLAERKITHIKRTGTTTCVTGNVGCAMQIQSEADRLGESLQVVHPVTLLHEAYFGESP